MGERQENKSGGSKGLGTKRALVVWLKEEDIESLRRIAHEKGIGHTTLVRMWVREKLKEHARSKG